MAAAIPPRIQERRSYSKAAECRPCTLVVRPQAAPALQSQPGGQLRRCRVAWPSEKFERALLSSALLRIACLVILYKTCRRTKNSQPMGYQDRYEDSRSTTQAK